MDFDHYCDFAVASSSDIAVAAVFAAGTKSEGYNDQRFEKQLELAR